MPEDSDAEEGEHLATSDTGDEEPVTFDRAGSDAGGREEVGEAATAPTHDTERAPTPETEGFVLDEFHETGDGFVGPESDEYLVFRNAGSEPIDLSGWTVENGAGRSYAFPGGTVLEPGERLTLHSGRGADTERDRYWNADEPVWEAKRSTVLVETAAGERVLRERIES